MLIADECNGSRIVVTMVVILSEVMEWQLVMLWNNFDNAYFLLCIETGTFLYMMFCNAVVLQLNWYIKSCH